MKHVWLVVLAVLFVGAALYLGETAPAPFDAEALAETQSAEGVNVYRPPESLDAVAGGATLPDDQRAPVGHPTILRIAETRHGPNECLASGERIVLRKWLTFSDLTPPNALDGG